MSWLISRLIVLYFRYSSLRRVVFRRMNSFMLLSILVWKETCETDSFPVQKLVDRNFFVLMKNLNFMINSHRVSN